MRVEGLPSVLVVDASVGLKWVVDEAGSDVAVALVAGRRLLTTALFWAEAGNALATKSRRGELSAAATDDAWRDLTAAPLEAAPLDAPSVGGALSLARELGHPIYDCCYLALAFVHRTLVVTADGRFARAVERHPSLRANVMHLDALEVAV